MAKKAKVRHVGVVRVPKKKKRIGDAERAARAKYQPKISGLKKEISDSRSYEKRIPSFYDAYRQELTGLQAGTDQRAQAQQQASEASRNALAATENAEYKRVHGIDKPVEADKQSIAAADSRRVASGVVSGVLGAQKASTYTAQAQSKGKERERRSELRRELRDTKSEKGEYKYQVRQENRAAKAKAQREAQKDALAQWRAEQTVAQGNARIAQGEARLQLAAQENRRDARLARARIRTARRGQNMSSATARARLAADQAKGQKGNSKDEFNAEVSRAVSAVAGSKKRDAWLKQPNALVTALTKKGFSGAAALEAVRRYLGK